MLALSAVAEIIAIVFNYYIFFKTDENPLTALCCAYAAFLLLPAAFLG